MPRTMLGEPSPFRPCGGPLAAAERSAGSPPGLDRLLATAATAAVAVTTPTAMPRTARERFRRFGARARATVGELAGKSPASSHAVPYMTCVDVFTTLHPITILTRDSRVRLLD